MAELHRESNQRQDEHLRLISTLRPVAACGLALFWAWSFCLIFSDNIYIDMGIDTENSILMKALMLTGSICALIAISLLKIKMTSNRVILLPITVGTLLPASICMLIGYQVSVPHAALSISWFLLGCSYGILIVEWPWLFMTSWRRRVNFYIAVSGALGAVIFLFVMMLDGLYKFAAVTLLPFVSVIVYLYVRSIINIDIRRIVSANEPTRLFTSTGIVLISYSILYGFTLSYLLMNLSTERSVPLIALSIAGGAGICFLAELLYRKFFPFALKLRFAFPVIALCVGAMLVSDESNVIIGAVLFMLLYAVELSNYTAIISIGSGHLPSPRKILVRGRLEPMVGFLVGWMLSWLLFGPLGFAGNRAATFFSLTLILLIAVVGFLVPLPVNIVSDKDEQRVPEGVRVSSRCALVAERFSLSSREKEVLILLYKGRNAQFIGSEFNISIYTVKTHIYHIYKKLGINSHQELISCIDKAR